MCDSIGIYFAFYPRNVNGNYFNQIIQKVPGMHTIKSFIINTFHFLIIKVIYNHMIEHLEIKYKNL